MKKTLMTMLVLLYQDKRKRTMIFDRVLYLILNVSWVLMLMHSNTIVSIRQPPTVVLKRYPSIHLDGIIDDNFDSEMHDLSPNVFYLPGMHSIPVPSVLQRWLQQLLQLLRSNDDDPDEESMVDDN